MGRNEVGGSSRTVLGGASNQRGAAATASLNLSGPVAPIARSVASVPARSN